MKIYYQRIKTHHGVHTATVAGLDQQPDVGIHERHSHGNIGPIRQHELRVVTELLDEGEDVIPTSTVQTGAVVTQFVDDFIHLESSSDGLNQHGSTDSTTRKANVILSQVEHIIPQPGLEVRLHLGQIEVRTGAASNELLGIVEEVETEVEQATGDGLAIDSEVLLLEVPASSTSNEGGEGAVGAQLVFLISLLEVDLATDGVVEVDLAIDHVVPCGSAGVWRALVGLFTHPQNQ